MAQAIIDTGCSFWYGKYGQMKLVTDEALNDSDKVLTVPAGKSWQIQHVYVEYIATAAAGNRQLLLEVRDAEDDVISTIPALNVQIANATEYYLFGVSGDVTETKAGYHFLPLGPLVWPTGYDVRVRDSAAVAAAADDMNIQMSVFEYDDN